MKGTSIILGAVLAMAAGWSAGRHWPPEKPAPAPAAAVDREGAARLLLPKDLKSADAVRWAAGLEEPVILGLIEREVADKETVTDPDALRLLIGVLFEMDGEAAANQWLRLYTLCPWELSSDFYRWAGRDPSGAAAWVERSLAELARFEGGLLVVNCASAVVREYAQQDLRAATRMVMERPAFFDQGCLLSLRLHGDWTEKELPLLKELAAWVKARGDNPGHAFSTLSGEPIDPEGEVISTLAMLDAEAARELLGELRSGDPRLKAWRERLSPILSRFGK